MYILRHTPPSDPLSSLSYNSYFKLVPAARLLACAEAVFAFSPSEPSEPGTQGQGQQEEGKGGKDDGGGDWADGGGDVET